MFARILTAVALLSFATAAQAQFPDPSEKWWGPTWQYKLPGGSSRPAKLADSVACTISGNGAPYALEMKLWGDVADLEKGKKYQLLYQFRVHTKAGEEGPILGDSNRPKGRAFVLKEASPGEGFWAGIEAMVDITRKDLSGMTGLPEVKAGEQTVFLRVEPHLYDVEKKKFVTPVRTPAAILVATVGPERNVSAIRPLNDWMAKEFTTKAQSVLDTIKGLDAIDAPACKIAEGFAQGLKNGGNFHDDMAKYIRAFPLEHFRDYPLNYDFYWLLQKYAKEEKGELQKASQERLDEYKKYHEKKK